MTTLLARGIQPRPHMALTRGYIHTGDLQRPARPEPWRAHPGYLLIAFGLGMGVGATLFGLAMAWLITR